MSSVRAYDVSLVVGAQYLVGRSGSEGVNLLACGLWNYGILVRSVLRSLTVVEVERCPLSLGLLVGVLHARLLLYESGELHRLRSVVSRSGVVEPRLAVACCVVLPVVLGLGISSSHLEYRCLSVVLRVGILNASAETNNHVVEEVERLACSVRAVVLVMLVQLHTEVAVYATL